MYVSRAAPRTDCIHLKNLMDELFEGYSPEVLPRCNPLDSVQVQLGLAVRQIVELNEPMQILETNTWVRMVWNDCQLTWNATETGIKNIAVPYRRVWVPDITLYDNAQNALGGLQQYRPNVYPNGDVYYNFPSVIRSLCKVDVTYFPFDTQVCKLQFGSWSYHGWDLNLTGMTSAADISMFVSNGEWDIIGVPAERNEIKYTCCPEPYPDVRFYVHMRRKPLFYLLNLIFPCSLISTIAILGFLLPPESGEKVSLEITVLLSLAVFLLVVSETMPADSETFPYIGVYFACAMGLVSLSCLMTVTVLNLHFKGEFGKRMPPWVRLVFLDWFGKILLVKTTDKLTQYENIKAQKTQAEAYENQGFPGLSTADKDSNYNDPLDAEHRTVTTSVLSDHRDVKMADLKGVKFDYNTSTEVVSLLKKQLDCIDKIQDHMEEKRRESLGMDEWRKLAQVVDRIFMVFFFLFQFGISSLILIRIISADPDVMHFYSAE
ncbi:neuronal acetylcholine receptor subunit alpha-7-like [Mya arenaria]|uniref:neuronal acetylcholine receptor subunit alpha-7-like n=1 Tax=Mya arenaria TaxID=6604 RepID=UPI0022E186B5|nr:neuronal acetylcholine receptor subunit alpha-7-like [Mya arenaria]